MPWPRESGSAGPLPTYGGHSGERYQLASATAQATKLPPTLAPAAPVELAPPQAQAPAPPAAPRWPAIGGLGLIVIACILLVAEHQPARAGTAEDRML
jgi:hypothetical protein